LKGLKSLLLRSEQNIPQANDATVLLSLVGPCCCYYYQRSTVAVPPDYITSLHPKWHTLTRVLTKYSALHREYGAIWDVPIL
jgi:hypothetical protein